LKVMWLNEQHDYQEGGNIRIF